MAEWLSRENRLRLFLGFLILVLIIVNFQSVQVSHQSRSLLVDTFRDEARARTENVTLEIISDLLQADSVVEAVVTGQLDEVASKSRLISICLLDWNGNRLAGTKTCRLGGGAVFNRLDETRKLELLETGLAVSEVTPPSSPNEAVAFGYRVIRMGDERPEIIVRVEVPATNIAMVNRSFRSTLLYQISALTLVLLALVLFLNNLLAPHRRLVAEARSVAGGLGRSTEAADESQFLLATFQTVVSRLKEKEKQLEEMHQQEKARADETEALAMDIIRSMTTGMVSLDEAGAVILVNPAAEKIFGFSAGSVVGKRFAEAFPGSPELAAWVESALTRGEFTLRRRVHYAPPGGEAIHLGVSVIPLLALGGKVRGALCLHADLSEVIQLREKLLLKENLARLGEMTAGIAHEFRNGLATILGNAKLLSQTDESGSASELLRALIEECNSLSHVLSEFLQFARPDTLRMVSVDLAVIAGEVAETLAPRARSSGVELSLRTEPCTVEADEILLRKAILNLVLNALEAASLKKSGGKVVLQVEAAPALEVALVRVSDNGPGIEPENRKRIFTPFFTTRPEGTGLGLALVQKIAVGHNGEVDVESEPEAGATFTLKIPLRDLPAPGLVEWV